jgi:hypothetical protein
MFLKVLYTLFRRQILELYHKEQPKRNGFDGMQKAFVDSSGRVYYQYVRDLDMPIKRFRECQKMLQLIKAGLSEGSLKMILALMRKSINSGVKSDIVKVAHMIEEMELRMGVFVDPEMLFKTSALMYVREDENPYEVDPLIHKQKIEQFKIDSEGGLKDFFYSTGIAAFIPFVGTTEEEFSEYLRESEFKMKALTMYLEKYTTEPVSS